MRSVHHHTRKQVGFRKGAATVEAAIFFPILILIFFATIEICNQIYFTQSVTIAAYEGGRVALIPESTVADVRQQVEEVAAARQLPTPTVTVTPSDYQNQPSGTLITVEVACDAQSVVGMNLFSSSSLGKASVTVMKEF